MNALAWLGVALLVAVCLGPHAPRRRRATRGRPRPPGDDGAEMASVPIRPRPACCKCFAPATPADNEGWAGITFHGAVGVFCPRCAPRRNAPDMYRQIVACAHIAARAANFRKN